MKSGKRDLFGQVGWLLLSLVDFLAVDLYMSAIVPGSVHALVTTNGSEPHGERFWFADGLVSLKKVDPRALKNVFNLRIVEAKLRNCCFQFRFVVGD